MDPPEQTGKMCIRDRFGGECKVDFAEFYEEIRFIYEKEEK